MKTSLKILFFAGALVVMSGCSAQKRAQRHIRKAVELCPALVQTKAHPIDTVLSVPGFADITTIGLPEVLKGDTVYAATNHGTFVVSVNQSDSSLRVGFVAAPREVRLQDTVHYAEVSLANPYLGESLHDGGEFLVGILCFVGGIAVALYLLIRRK